VVRVHSKILPNRAIYKLNDISEAGASVISDIIQIGKIRKYRSIIVIYGKYLRKFGNIFIRKWALII
jgi:hypothetical protein